MRPYLITAKLMRPSNMKRFPTPGLVNTLSAAGEVKSEEESVSDYETDVCVTGKAVVVYFKLLFSLVPLTKEVRLMRSSFCLYIPR